MKKLKVKSRKSKGQSELKVESRKGRALAIVLFIFFAFLSTFTFRLPTASAQNIASVTALGNNPASSQVTCQSTATLLYSPTTQGAAAGAPWGRLSVWFENQSSNPVYIAPRLDISTSNAAILLITQGHTFNFDRTAGSNVTWYCITASGSATVGVLEEK
jgi:hypothetical protein